MIYDPELKKGVRKRCLPEPNRSKVEVEVASTLLDIKQKAKELFFFYYATHPEDLVMVDSSGVPIVVTDPTTWTIGSFLQNHGLQPSRYKMYFMLDLKVSSVIYVVCISICCLCILNYCRRKLKYKNAVNHKQKRN